MSKSRLTISRRCKRQLQKRLWRRFDETPDDASNEQLHARLWDAVEHWNHVTGMDIDHEDAIQELFYNAERPTQDESSRR